MRIGIIAEHEFNFASGRWDVSKESRAKILNLLTHGVAIGAAVWRLDENQVETPEFDPSYNIVW